MSQHDHPALIRKRSERDLSHERQMSRLRLIRFAQRQWIAHTFHYHLRKKSSLSRIERVR